MLRRISIAIANTALATCPLTAQDQVPAKVDFPGVYDGGGFETASTMRIREDGTFEWNLSVGALDLRARGSWRREGEEIVFTSDPKPVPPEFEWAGFDETSDQPFLRIFNAANGEPFEYASLIAVCSNGQRLSDQVELGIWSPSGEDECDVPEKVQFRINMFDLKSRPFDLNGPLKPEPGQTIVFHFKPNDIGITDFTGVRGWFADGRLKITGPLGDQELRRIERQIEE